MNDKRKVTLTTSVFFKFLELGSITYEDLKTKFETPDFENKEHGSVIVFCELTGIYATMWIGVNNVSLMVGREEIKSFKFLIQWL